MMHLLRNAVDHGIEPTAERAAAGKPPEGTIRLRLSPGQPGGHRNQPTTAAASICRRWSTKAVARGIITAEQAAHLRESEALDLIFQASLSTASEVTEISGRGVGMDIVKAVMDRLKGSISVRTVLGQGTTFRLKVPLTLAIIKALLFRIADRLYAVPLGNVLEILRSRRAKCTWSTDRRCCKSAKRWCRSSASASMHPGGERKAQAIRHCGQHRRP